MQKNGETIFMLGESAMQKYTDLTKQPFSVQNANFLRKNGQGYPRRIKPTNSKNNSGNEQMNLPLQRNYGNAPWDYNYGPPLPASYPTFEAKKSRNIKGLLLIVAIVITTSLYVYSEASHNENSVFYKMKEISILFLQNKGFMAANEETLENGSEMNTGNGNEANSANVAEMKPNDRNEINSTADDTAANIINSSNSLYVNAKPTNSLIINAFMPLSDVDGSITFVNTGIEINDSSGIEYGDALREMINNKPGLDEPWQNFFDGKVKIRKAWLENETLIIDFNRSFEYSRYGYHGLAARIQQVLHTVFSLPPLLDSEHIIPRQEIKYVSLLIEGRRKDEIGGDGMVLSPFYSKEDLVNEITPKM